MHYHGEMKLLWCTQVDVNHSDEEGHYVQRIKRMKLLLKHFEKLMPSYLSNEWSDPQ